MKRIFNVVILTISSILMLNLTACNINRNTFVVAMSPDYAPFQFIDPRNSRRNNQHIVGADVDLARFIAGKMGKELVIKPMQFRETLVAVQMGRVDVAISGFSRTEERENNFAMSHSYRPVSNDFEGLLISNNRLEEFQTLEDFNDSNITIAVQNASLQELIAQEELPNANFQRVNTIQDGIMLLRAGRVDAVAIYSGTGRVITGNPANSDLVIPYEIRFESENVSPDLHVIARLGNPIIDEIDRIIKEYVINEEYKGFDFLRQMDIALALALEVSEHITRRREFI